MNIILEHERAALLHGDASKIDTILDENSVDAIVTDPPAGISFMGKNWDSDKGGRDKWVAWLADLMSASFRVLKPGGHALVWAIPRTSHWTMLALEDAGFEIRDTIHDILSVDDVAQGFLDSLNDEQRKALARILESESSPILYHLFGTGFPKSLTPKSAPIPDGTGTALKPAVEHWILARKPLEGTYADNVKKYGTGVLNIDATRIGTGEVRSKIDATANVIQGDGRFGNMAGSRATGITTEGRWPAHLTLDEKTAKMLDEQSGITTSGAMKRTVEAFDGTSVTGFLRGKSGPHNQHGGKGGASRFFYVAKAPRSEKDKGLDHLPSKSGGEATGRADGSKGTQSPRAGAGRTGGARNIHPTVKNLALMKWLIQLVTPPGGIVLDPFAGSGSTGVAALELGYSFVGCELGGDDDEYLPILLGRVRHALGLLAE